MSSRIDWDVEGGFLDDARYRFHYHKIFKDYEKEFQGADQIKVLLKEKPYSMLNFPDDPWLKISDDGKAVSIIFIDSRYYDQSGRQKSIPEPSAVFRNLRLLMGKAALEYSNRFANSKIHSKS